MNAPTSVPSSISELRPGAITRTTLALFAGASGDHNPIHIDIDSAKASGMDDVFAHGMLSMAYLGRLLTDWIPQSRILELTTRFTAITPVHAEPVLRAEIRDTEVVDGQERARLDLEVELADGTTTLKGTAVVAL
ncbi:MaoC/PaaZ C-terminal domain-containing protein [Gordonia amicalis]|uniref:MaoC/PaaZ C-terminal domain-containing protein n=1 Tax=Gordonia amicalis TaxID=89053 RepID=UPI0002A6357D|nr:MaoC/PaaZ C-terminal domain-containing protein [Gordonia amicalis]MBA5849667.1 MaoC family dehydratase N-terminal domain-containing protein [Gordonia amicalis]MDV7173826.1 MaoC/PaaZ C-terminal domain-containing protein [Gordonia amicalis]NKX76801.1 dehydratase [Gordonia amicalis]UKO90854.1 MaoC family dehydratase N-terminal domain-containing protein [Gordonia amicalis]UOG22365.1 MaoC family dehydratase N-terminal domain-containing protein [Gordonia amicalis]